MRSVPGEREDLVSSNKTYTKGELVGCGLLRRYDRPQAND